VAPARAGWPPSGDEAGPPAPEQAPSPGNMRQNDTQTT
jgi:hypothetical protein